MADLRSCPFCSGSALTMATATDETTVTVAVVCLEFGAAGPKGMNSDPLSHVERLWNQRFAVDQ